MREVRDKSLPPNTDVLILGGGVIGLSIARVLHKLGVKDIAVVERDTCGYGATWAAAGMLSPQAETDELGPFFDLCSRSRDMYPEFADALLDETDIDIELDRTGTLGVALNGDDHAGLLARYEWQRDAGLAVESVSREQLREAEPYLSDNFEFGLRFPNDWQVENRRLAGALIRYADLNGIRVIEDTKVDELFVDGDRITGATTSAGAVHATATVVATGAWTSLIKVGGNSLPVDVEPVRGQMVCLTSDERPLRHVVYTHRGYLVPRRDGRILSGSTSERVGFDAANTEDALDRLTGLASEVLPNARLRVTDSWAGLRPCAPDGLPVIGGLSGLEGVVVATGHYRNGILLAPMTAQVVAERIVNGTHDDVFSTFGPQRFAMAATGL